MIAAALIGVLVLYSLGNEKRQPEGTGSGGTESAASTSPCRVTVTADILNVRAEPSASGQKVGSFRKDAQIDAEKVVQNGFRKLGENRWASNDYLRPLAGRDCG